MATTIRDVAALANVSVSTVSRVLNNSAPVSTAKKKRIKKAIEILGYQPNIIAQSLVSKRLKNIAVVLTRSPYDAFVSPYYSIMMSGLGNVLESSGYELLLVFAKDEDTEIQKCLSLISAGTIQGIIVLGSRVYDRLINKLIEVNFPFVLIGRVHPDSIPKNAGLHYVNTDNLGDSYKAVEYLIQNGHTRIGLIHSPLKYMVNQDRHDGYVSALRDAGVPINYHYIVDGGYSVEDATAAAGRLLDMPQRPTAVFCTDDVKAAVVVHQASRRGLSVPADLSVIGHNNYEHSLLSLPPLTTVSIPMVETAERAAKIILKVIKEPGLPYQKEILPSNLVIRESVRPL